MAVLGMQLQLDNKQAVTEEYIAFVKKLSADNKISLGFDFDSAKEVDKMKSQIEILSKQFSQAFAKSDISGLTVIAEGVKNVGLEVDGLVSRQIKYVNNIPQQMTENIKKSVLESQKIVTSMKNEKPPVVTDTTNVAKAQVTLYGELNKLQRDEFSLRSALIGQDGKIKSELEMQLGLVKSQQTEVAKLVAQYNVQGSDKISEYLRNRKFLTSDLVIEQEKYNNSVKAGNDKANDKQAKIDAKASSDKAKQIENDALLASKAESDKAKQIEAQLRYEQSVRRSIAKEAERDALSASNADKKKAKEIEAQLQYEQTVRRAIAKENEATNAKAFKDASDNLNKISKLESNPSNAGTQMKIVNDKEIADIKKKNIELFNLLTTEQLVMLKEQELANSNKNTAKSGDNQMAIQYQISKGLLNDIYDLKGKIATTDAQDSQTMEKLNKNLVDLQGKSDASRAILAKANASEHIIQLDNQELELQNKINSAIELGASKEAFKAKQAEAERVAKLGDLKTQVSSNEGNLFAKNNEELKKYIQTLYEAKIASVNFARGAESAENASIKFTVTTKNSKNEKIQETLVWDKNTNAIYRNNEAITDTTKKTESMGDKMKHAFEAVASFATVTTMFYQVLHNIQDGIHTVIELNSALTTINMTMDMTSGEMGNLVTSSQAMAKEMGLSIDEVLNAVKVYANAQETVASILDKTKADIMLATASGMSTTDTTDSIQAIMNQFELDATGSAERIADTLEKVSANMAMDFGITYAD